MASNTVRTRFAPSPTGNMHIGNLRTALYAYLFAKSEQGQFILRIEDTDTKRFVEGSIDTIYKTLKASRIFHDEGPDIGGPCGPYIQSERKDLYVEHAHKMVEDGNAYFCFCSKERLEEIKETHPEGYDRHCRSLSKEAADEKLASGVPYVIRQKMDSEGSTVFSDIVYGDIEVENRVLEDQVILKSDGLPTYNFANVIDDHLMGITHVIRGSEYLSSTPKYNKIYEAFGWTIPQYIHLPLINGKNPDGSVSKLSKRHGSTSFENLVSDGYLPEAIINYIALLGWSPKNDGEIFSLDELIQGFSLSGINKSPAIFDYAKLEWMNGEYIRQMSMGDFAETAYPFSKLEGTELAEKWTSIAELLQQRITRFTQIPEMIAFLHGLPSYEVSLFLHKKNKSTLSSSLEILSALDLPLRSIDDWEHDAIYAAIQEYSVKASLKLGQVMWPLRIALTGQAVTPGGVVEIMTILGKEECLERLAKAIETLKSEV